MKRAAASAALGLLLLLCAATFAMRSLYVPALALIVLGGGFAAWVALAAHGAQLEREPGPATVEEDAPWPIRILIRPGVLPAPGGEILEPLLPDPIGVGRVPVDRNGVRRVRVEVRFSRRGKRVLEPATLVVRDPLGLAERDITSRGRQGEVLVLPRIEPVLPVEGGGAPGIEGRGREGGDGGRAARAPAPELELDVLRPYREGVPATRIHWPTLARTGELMERRFVADPRARPLIVVDAHDPEGDRELDAAVRAAASLAYHLARAGGCAVLMPGDRRPTPLSPGLRLFGEVHARLALLQATPVIPGLSARRQTGPLVWVTASRAVPILPERLGAGWIVAPHPVAPDAAVEFRVAGCIGQRLASVWKAAA